MPSLSRRRRAPALALTLVALLGLTACRSAVDVQSSGAGPATGAVTRGGDLRVGVLGDLSPKTFIQIGTAPANGHVLANVFDTLITYPHDSTTPKPSLATSWRLAPDGRSLTLDLRRGVRFHSGREFVSADVERSLRAYLDDGWTPQFKRTAAAVTGFDVTDPHRVTLSFAHPLSNIFDLLDSAPILDGDSLDALRAGKEFNGTGPFKFASWQPNSQVRLLRNDDYWGGAPPLQSVTLVEARDPKSLYTRLRTGQLDVVDAGGLTDQDQQLATKRYGFGAVDQVGAENQIYLGVNVANPALQDVRVRKAIALALDRDRIIRDVYRGRGYPVNLPWPKWSPAYDASANKTYQRDVDQARTLLAQAGPVPTIPLDYPAVGSTRVVAEIVQSNLKDIGITVNLVPNDTTVQSTKLIGAKFPGVWLNLHAFAQFTPSTLAVSAYPFNAAKNSSNYQNPAYAAAANAAWQTLDPKSPPALAAYRALDRTWLDDLFLIEIGVLIPNATTAPTVRGVDWDRRSQLHLHGASLTAPNRRS
ncbi:MAG: ABC transporter substrate-binding protein [Gordonia sp. (in: high G+C Gram-positive bacteria)]